MTPKKRAAIAAAVVTACFGSVTALGDDHTSGGTPGTPGCVGQQEAFFAQLGKHFDGPVPNGIGGLVKSSGISAPDLHAAAVANCEVSP